MRWWHLCKETSKQEVIKSDFISNKHVQNNLTNITHGHSYKCPIYHLLDAIFIYNCSNILLTRRHFLFKYQIHYLIDTIFIYKFPTHTVNFRWLNSSDCVLNITNPGRWYCFDWPYIKCIITCSKVCNYIQYFFLNCTWYVSLKNAVCKLKNFFVINYPRLTRR